MVMQSRKSQRLQSIKEKAALFYTLGSLSGFHVISDAAPPLLASMYHNVSVSHLQNMSATVSPGSYDVFLLSKSTVGTQACRFQPCAKRVVVAAVKIQGE